MLQYIPHESEVDPECTCVYCVEARRRFAEAMGRTITCSDPPRQPMLHEWQWQHDGHMEECGDCTEGQDECDTCEGTGIVWVRHILLH